MGLFWVSGHSGIRANEIADELAKEGTVQRFVGPEPALGFSRQITRRKIKNSELTTCIWRCGGVLRPPETDSVNDLGPQSDF